MIPAGRLIKVKVHAGSKKYFLVQKKEDSFEAWTKAPAERGLANRAVLALLAERFGRPAGAFRIVKGARTPSKIIQVPI